MLAFKLMGGDQVPVILLIDVVGKVKLCPAQNGPICVKVGVILGVTETVMVVGLAHTAGLGVGVKV